MLKLCGVWDISSHRYKPDYGYSWKMLLVMIVLPLIYSVMISLVQMVIAECVFSILGTAVVIYRRNIVVEIST